MDDTPEPVETSLAVPVQPGTIARVDQMPGQQQPFARSRALPAIFYNAQMDFPGHIQKAVMDVQASFEGGDWTYFQGGEAWFRLNSSLDMIASWVSSQVDAKGILRGSVHATFFDDYRELDDTVEDLLDLPFKKVEMIGAAMQTVGMALKEGEKPLAPIPHDQMAKIFRFTIQNPGPNELEKYGIAQVAAYWKENMIDLGLDVFCVVECPKRIYPFGLGKSTLMVQLGGALANALDTDFDVRHDIAYATDVPRVRRFFDDHRKKVIRQVDEAKVIWGRRTHAVGRQREEMGLLSMTRKDEQVWLAAVSNLFRLDHDIFEEKATHVLRILDPGVVTIKRGWGQAILYEKADFDEVEDRWGRRRIPMKWIDFPRGAGIRKVYLACDSYTKSHVRKIVEDGVSPLDELLVDKPEWMADELREPLPDGGAIAKDKDSAESREN